MVWMGEDRIDVINNQVKWNKRQMKCNSVGEREAEREEVIRRKVNEKNYVMDKVFLSSFQFYFISTSSSFSITWVEM